MTNFITHTPQVNDTPPQEVAATGHQDESGTNFEFEESKQLDQSLNETVNTQPSFVKSPWSAEELPVQTSTIVDESTIDYFKPPVGVADSMVSDQQKLLSELDESYDHKLSKDAPFNNQTSDLPQADDAHHMQTGPI